MMKLFYFLLIVLVSGVACKKKPQPGYDVFELKKPFELRMNGTARLEGKEMLAFSFTAVPSDSRCPKSVTCIHEGEVEVQAEVSTGDASKTISFTKSASQLDAVLTPYGGYKFFLLEVNPYPLKPGKIKQGDYSIKVVVERE